MIPIKHTTHQLEQTIIHFLSDYFSYLKLLMVIHANCRTPGCFLFYLRYSYLSHLSDQVYQLKMETAVIRLVWRIVLHGRPLSSFLTCIMVLSFKYIHTGSFMNHDVWLDIWRLHRIVVFVSKYLQNRYNIQAAFSVFYWWIKRPMCQESPDSSYATDQS